jgi:hypothetical protein
MLSFRPSEAESAPPNTTATQMGESVPSPASADVRASLDDALTAADVHAAYVLDCKSYPCLAVFTDAAPSMAERDSVFERLGAAMPESPLISSTLLGGGHPVVWVLVLAHAEPADQSAVDARIAELLSE